jgi:hypothetical protein
MPEAIRYHSERVSLPSRARTPRQTKRLLKGALATPNINAFLHWRSLAAEARARSVIGERASAVLIRGGAAAISRLSNVGGLLRYRDDNRTDSGFV